MSRHRTWEEYKESLDFNLEETSEYRQTRLAFALGKMLRRARQSLGHTQTQLASDMTTSQPNVARLEGGANVPSLDTLIRFADAVGGRLVVGILSEEELANYDLPELVQSGAVVVDPPPESDGMSDAVSTESLFSPFLAKLGSGAHQHVRRTIDVEQPIAAVCNQWPVVKEDVPMFDARQVLSSKCVVAWEVEGQGHRRAMSFKSIAPDRTEIALELDVAPRAYGEAGIKGLGKIEEEAEGDLKRFREYLERKDGGAGTPGHS